MNKKKQEKTFDCWSNLCIIEYKVNQKVIITYGGD